MPESDPGGGHSEDQELTFVFRINKSAGSTLGINVVCSSGMPRTGGGVFVSKVFDEGLVNDWNKTSSEPRRVRKGDFIFRVNDVQDNTVAMIQELKVKQELTIEVLRTRAATQAGASAGACRPSSQEWLGAWKTAPGMTSTDGLQPLPPVSPDAASQQGSGPALAPPATGNPQPPVFPPPGTMPFQGSKKCPGQSADVLPAKTSRFPMPPPPPPLPRALFGGSGAGADPSAGPSGARDGGAAEAPALKASLLEAPSTPPAPAFARPSFAAMQPPVAEDPARSGIEQPPEAQEGAAGFMQDPSHDNQETTPEASVEALLAEFNALGAEALGGLICLALERRPWLTAAVLGNIEG